MTIDEEIDDYVNKYYLQPDVVLAYKTCKDAYSEKEFENIMKIMCDNIQKAINGELSKGGKTPTFAEAVVLLVGTPLKQKMTFEEIIENQLIDIQYKAALVYHTLKINQQ